MSFLLIDHKTNQCLWLWLFLALKSSVASRYDAVFLGVGEEKSLYLSFHQKNRKQRSQRLLLWSVFMFTDQSS